jgi:hypothetical protein
MDHVVSDTRSMPVAADLTDRAEKLLSLAALGIAIEIVFFKFLPDLSTALIQHDQSALTDFAQFERMYLTPGSVHHARFLGNYILYSLARLLSGLYHSTDLRLHPLRVAAGILSPAYAYLGAYFALRDPARLAWRFFIVPYALAVVIGLYVFYPADLPSLAFLSMAVFFLLEKRLWLTLLLMLITGLFRESSLHIVWLVAAWAWCDGSRGLRERAAWVLAFGLAFVLEYVAVRHFFPGPVSSAGGVIFDLRVLFLDKGLLSLTTLCSVGLAALFPLACLIRARNIAAGDWRRRFFMLNACAFPAWLVFYRMMNGNLSEFRMLFPVLVPCIYGIAYGAAASNRERR